MKKPRPWGNRTPDYYYGLRYRMRLFIHFLTMHGDGADAITQAGYKVRDRHDAHSKASALLKRPGVSRALNEKIKEEYPHIEGEFAQAINDRIKELSDPSLSLRDKRENMKLIAELMGFYAPKKETEKKKKGTSAPFVPPKA